VVFNEKASVAYESACDASKFMSENKLIPQLYTIGNDDTQYAINERPAQDGNVRLGIYIPADGTYTLKVKRNRDAGTVYLKDNDYDTVSDITDTEYSFYAEAGSHTNRFVLVGANATGIQDIAKSAGAQSSQSVYDMMGRKVDNNRVHGGIYLIQQNGKTRKVSVK
jgi:hypothetical protein